MLTSQTENKKGTGVKMDVKRIYNGSDGIATREMYAALEAFGVRGVVAVNLFRAQKCSSRAKVYRGGVKGKGRFKDMAYDRKAWSMQNLCRILVEHAPSVGIRFGWARDESQSLNSHVLYVDLPEGQVSFHSPVRYIGPDYLGKWDGDHQSEERIIAFTQATMDMAEAEGHLCR